LHQITGITAGGENSGKRLAKSRLRYALIKEMIVRAFMRFTRYVGCREEMSDECPAGRATLTRQHARIDLHA